jgi:hypothetical protein
LACLKLALIGFVFWGADGRRVVGDQGIRRGKANIKGMCPRRRVAKLQIKFERVHRCEGFLVLFDEK